MAHSMLRRILFAGIILTGWGTHQPAARAERWATWIVAPRMLSVAGERCYRRHRQERFLSD